MISLFSYEYGAARFYLFNIRFTAHPFTATRLREGSIAMRAIPKGARQRAKKQLIENRRSSCFALAVKQNPGHGAVNKGETTSRPLHILRVGSTAKRAIPKGARQRAKETRHGVLKTGKPFNPQIAQNGISTYDRLRNSSFFCKILSEA